MAATAQVWGCPVAPCTIDSPLTQFCCVVKRRLTKVVAAQVAVEAVVAWVGWLPKKNCMSRRLKGVVTVSVPPAQYSPGRRRKKEAIQESSAIAWSHGESLLAAVSMQWRMETGRGAYSSGGRIFFRVDRKLSSQAKVDGAHDVKSWVRGPHGRKDLSHGADVLLHASLVDGLFFICQDACA